MTKRCVVEWRACDPIGQKAVMLRGFRRNDHTRVLGHVWPKRRGWCASDRSGAFLGTFRSEEAARRRVVQGQVLNGEPVLVRSRG